MTEHTQTRSPIPWLRITAEGLAIILSILMALGVDAMWDTRNERADERTALNSLLVDFEENLERIQQSIRTHERYQSAASDLLAIADDPALRSGAEQIDSLLSQVFLAATSVHMANGSLQALLSSGRLGILRNQELRALLAAWPSWVEENAEDEQWLINDVQQRLSPYLNSRIRARNVYLSDPGIPVVISRLPVQDYAALWSDPEFDNLVTYRLYGEAATILETRRLEEETERVIALLRTELSL